MRYVRAEPSRLVMVAAAELVYSDFTCSQRLDVTLGLVTIVISTAFITKFNTNLLSKVVGMLLAVLLHFAITEIRPRYMTQP